MTACMKLRHAIIVYPNAKCNVRTPKQHKIYTITIWLVTQGTLHMERIQRIKSR